MTKHIHLHLHDSGTSEGARKAAITRKQHGGGHKTGAYEPSPHTHPGGTPAMSGHAYYEQSRKTRGTFSGATPWGKLSPQTKAQWHKVAFEQEQGLFNSVRKYAGQKEKGGGRRQVTPAERAEIAAHNARSKKLTQEVLKRRKLENSAK